MDFICPKKKAASSVTIICIICFFVVAGVLQLSEKQSHSVIISPIQPSSRAEIIATKTEHDENLVMNSLRSKIGNKLIKISRDIALLGEKSRSSTAFTKISSVIRQLDDVMQDLQMEPETQLSETTESKSVCPEIYTVKSGYSITKCNNSDSLEKVVSILLNFVHVPQNKQKNILSGIQEYHDNIRVVVAVTDVDKNQYYSNFKLSIEQHKFSSGISEGSLWNRLVSLAKTPFVLIGRDLDLFTVDARLERLVREIELLNVPIVGGATRTPDGHWKMGCDQVAYKNFTVVYKSGYDKSKHECVFCDHFSGPFMAKTEYLRKYPLKDKLQSSILFHDFMMQLFTKHQPVVVCPDVMYHVSSESGKEISREKWIPFAQEWKLNRLRLPSGTVHKFTEKESLTKCTKNFGKASSPQCLQHLADTVKFVMKTCEEHDVMCELRAGTVLGTLKFGSVIPWERDGDIGFYYRDSNYSAFRNTINKMRHGDYNMRERGNNAEWQKEFRKIVIPVTGWRVEAIGSNNMDSLDLLKKGLRPTKTILDGQWVNVPRNPGLYARNKFGYELYRHQEHVPTYLGSEYFYHPSSFRACPTSKAHDCLDQYPSDGNLQFGEPEP